MIWSDEVNLALAADAQAKAASKTDIHVIRPESEKLINEIPNTAPVLIGGGENVEQNQALAPHEDVAAEVAISTTLENLLNELVEADAAVAEAESDVEVSLIVIETPLPALNVFPNR